MNRTILIAHFEQAERHVREGRQHIDRQRRVVAELERDGHPSEMSRELLDTFEQLQAQHVADRDRLAAELARNR